ncbi:unnamed protein product [Diamesa hyperborea]
MAIEWINPLKAPAERRIQVLSAFCFVMMIAFAESVTIFLFVNLWLKGGSIIKTCCLLYILFMIYDRNAGETGSRGQGSEWIRNWTWWKYFASYFPIKIVKTADLPPNKNYVFGAFPHGLISIGAFGNFATNATDFRKKFPAIRAKLCTLNYHFYVPLFREIVLGWGMMSSKYSAIKRVLNQSNSKAAECNNDGFTSNACIVMVGGAQEALNSRPGSYQLVLKKRRGFIKLALETGSSLVPIFSFGEVDLFEQAANPPGSFLRKFQDAFKRVTGVSPIVPIGRGFLQYSYGLIPRSYPITTLVGAPINVTKIESPTKEEIEKLHSEFCEALSNLFENHKQKYLKNYENIKLIID